MPQDTKETKNVAIQAVVVSQPVESVKSDDISESVKAAAKREKKATKEIKNSLKIGIMEVFYDACNQLDKLEQAGLPMPRDLKIEATIDLRPR